MCIRDRRISSEIAGLGSNMILVAPTMRRGTGSMDASRLLSIDMADEIMAAAPAVSAVSPVAQIEGTLRWGSSTASASIVGVSPAYMGIVLSLIHIFWYAKHYVEKATEGWEQPQNPQIYRGPDKNGLWYLFSY